MSLHLVFLIHFFTTACMAGVIWIVQLVHYPSFHYVNPTSFAEFSVFHQRAISYVVMPLMLLELISGLYLALVMPSLKVFLWMNFAMLVGIWLSTFFLSVPLHNELIKGFNSEIIQQLVRTNWPRTILWTLRMGILSYLILRVCELRP